MKKRIIWSHEKNIILCMVLLITIYTIALAVLPSHLEQDWGFYDGSWLKHLFQLAKMGIITFFLSKAHMHWNLDKRGLTAALYLFCAFLILCLGGYINFSYMQYVLQKFCILIWPIFVLFLATHVQRMEDKLHIGTCSYKKALYYILVLLSVWFVTDVLSYVHMFKRDISDMLYLFGCAGIAWYICKAFTNKDIGKPLHITWEVISNFLFCVGSMAIFLINHERFEQIFNSLKNRNKLLSRKGIAYT